MISKLLFPFCDQDRATGGPVFSPGAGRTRTRCGRRAGQVAFDFSSDEYAALFAGSAATAFQHPLWLDSIYSKLAPACGTNRLVITVRTRAIGELVMILPMLRVRRGPIRTVELAAAPDGL